MFTRSQGELKRDASRRNARRKERGGKKETIFPNPRIQRETSKDNRVVGRKRCDGSFQPPGNSREATEATRRRGDGMQDLRRSTALPHRNPDLSPRNFIGSRYYSSSSRAAMTDGITRPPSVGIFPAKTFPKCLFTGTFAMKSSRYSEYYLSQSSAAKHAGRAIVFAHDFTIVKQSALER